MQTVFDKVLYRNEVEKVLKELQSIICNKDFSIDNNLVLILKSKNKQFMQDNFLDRDDVIKVLKSLKVTNYIKSVLDNKDINGLYLHEFATAYSGIKYIYIKFKIIDDDIIIKIVSFHQNEYALKFAFNDK